MQTKILECQRARNFKNYTNHIEYMVQQTKLLLRHKMQFVG